MDWSLALILFAAVVIIFHPAWRAGFIWDDDAHLTHNPCIVGPLGFRAIWTSSAAVYYPLVLTSFWVQHALWGLNPIPYHLVNIAMHGACAVLLWRLLLALQVRGAWLGAALWALHPVMVESVAWITELKNTQSCLFYLLAILFFLRWWKISSGSGDSTGPARGWYCLAVVCGILAILSKSSTVMLPVVLGLCAWWLGARFSARTIGMLVPFLLVSLAASGWTVWEQKFHSGALGHEWEQSWPERFVIAGKAVWFYFGKLIWPHPLIFVYPRWKIDSTQLLAWLPAAGVAAILFILWRGRDGRMRPLFFAAGYFVISLFPVLGFFSIYYFRYSFVADHFQYLASIGPLALAGAGAAVLSDSWVGSARWLRPAGCAIAVAALGFLSADQCGAYSNVETLWKATLAQNPDCWLGYDNLGTELLQQGDVEEAAAQFLRALEINPADGDAHYNIGIIAYQQGRVEDAIAQYRQALELDPTLVEAADNLGSTLLQQGRTDEAIAGFRQAIQINPMLSKPHDDLGNALLRQGHLDEALGQYREALRINPSNAQAHASLADALLQQGRTEEAIDHYEEACRLNPADPNARCNMGVALCKMGRLDEGIAQYREALQINPTFAEAYGNLGVALFQQGRVEEAIAAYRQAVQINPAYPMAQFNLGNALFAHGQTAEAIVHMEKALALQPANPAVQNALAWTLGTAPQASLRDGPRAVQLATQLCQASGGGNPIALRTLAAAYAQAARYPDAVRTAQEALQLAQARSNSALATALAREINLYEGGRPFEEAQ
jgi:tetratricopeptide (TPR) repeat protein